MYTANSESSHVYYDEEEDPKHSKTYASRTVALVAVVALLVHDHDLDLLLLWW
jgi:hypothetical protein